MPNRGTWLQKGTSRMKPRPHYDKVLERAKANAAARIQSDL